MRGLLALLACGLLCGCLRDYRTNLPCEGDEHCPFGMWCRPSGTCVGPGGVDDDAIPPEGLSTFDVEAGARAVFTGFLASWGTNVGAPGDITGDGLPNVVVAGQGVGDNGTVHIFGGDLMGPIATEEALSVLSGSGFGGAGGAEFGGGGDLTGDGLPDLVVSALSHGSPLSDAGRVYLVEGPVAPDSQPLEWSYASWRGDANEHLGFGLSQGLLEDADGIPRPALAMSTAGEGVYVEFAPIEPGDHRALNAGAHVGDTESYPRVGPQTLIAQLELSPPGPSHALLTQAETNSLSSALLHVDLPAGVTRAEDHAARFGGIGATLKSYFGAHLAAGDLTGDSVPDLVVSSLQSTSLELHVYAGPIQVDSASFAPVDRLIRVPFAGVSGHLALADLNGDGQADLVVRTRTGKQAALAVFLGPLLEDTSATEDAALLLVRSLEFDDDPVFGVRFVNAGDLDGGGADDLLISGRRVDSPGNAYIVRGEDLFPSSQ